MLHYSQIRFLNRRTLFALLLVSSLILAALPTAVFAAPTAAPTASGYHHVVKYGETLSHVARRYGVTVYALAYANGLSDKDYVYVGQRLYIPPVSGAPAGCKSYYHVKHGDTLSEIAAWYGIKSYALANANYLGNANHIYVGQKVCIPNIYGSPYSNGHKPGYGYGYHRVKVGDTLSEIAQWYGTSVHYLMKINRLYDADNIYIGQKLRIG